MKLTEEQKDIVKQKIEQELARRDYAEYCKYAHNNFILAEHIKYICRAVEDLIYNVTDKQILILSMPPQHGKSQTITETLPSFYLGKYPNKRVIEVSYGDDLARRFGRRNKQKILEFGKDLFNIELAKGGTSDTDLEIDTYKGTMLSRGIMAGITGQPADLIIIDDPIKNKAEAESETYRERIWDEFLNSIYTRLSAQGKIILIMTRWHEDDLAGRLLKYMPDKCKYINIPCEAEQNDILGRNVGDALFTEIGKDKAWMQEFKKAYTTQEGNRAWLALFQGRPTAQEGNMIKRKWFNYYNIMPSRFDKVIQSWDCTFKDSDGSDYVVGTVWGRVGADKYLLDLVRDRMDLPTTIEAIIQTSNKWKNAHLKLIEDKANGSAVIQMLKHKLSGIVAVEPEGGKIARVQAILPNIEAGNVYLPQDAYWLNDFIEECTAFPNGKHDDQVDSMSQALVKLMNEWSNAPQEQPHYNFPSERPKPNAIGTVTESFFKGGWS